MEDLSKNIPHNAPIHAVMAAREAAKVGDAIDHGYGAVNTKLNILIATIRDLSDLCFGGAVNKGWYTNIHTGGYDPVDFPKQIALMHSELSEALKAWNTDTMDDHLKHRIGLEVELADAVIRILNVGAAMQLDIPQAIIEKLEYNRKRKDHELEARRREGGKKC